MPPLKKKGSAVTVIDVADHAGVAVMTVSRVINGYKHVSEAKRAKVLASIKALGYSPNLAGRSLRTLSTLRIGILYSNPSAAYLNQFMVGALQQGTASGSQLMIEKCAGQKSQRAAVDRLVAAGVDCVILPPPLCDSKATLAMLDTAGVLAIAVATARPLPGISAVRIDDYQGALAMTRHLISLGHKDIGFIKGDPHHTPAALRLEAFLDGMREAGLKVAPNRIAEGNFTYRSGLTAAEQLLKGRSRPTAIFCCNDDMAAAALAIAHGLGLRIPEDISVCGFDDTPVATTVWPELTTIHQPVTAMGKVAISLAVDEIQRRRQGLERAGTHEVMKFTLVKRQSCAAAT